MTKAPSICTSLLGLVAVIGMIVLALGWGLGIAPLISILPGLPGMAPSTAFCFMVSAGAMLAGLRCGPGLFGVDITSRLALALGTLIVGGIAIGDLIVREMGLARGIDGWVFASLRGDSASQMSVATAVSFLFLAMCLAIWAVSSKTHAVATARSLSLFATTGLAINLVALIGHILGTATLDNVIFFEGIALHTAVLFLIMFLVNVRLAPGGSWLAFFTGDGIGSRGLRYLFPLFLLAPLALGWLVIRSSVSGYLPVEFHTSLLVSGMVLLGLAAIAVNGYGANRLEAERDRSHALQEALGENQLLLAEVNHRVKNNLQQIDVLLALESSSLTDEQARRSYAAMSGRIRALSMVHQSLLASTQQGRINIQGYLNELCQGIILGAGMKRRNINFETSFESISVPFERAITLGLLVNELVANALKHAFEGRDSGQITASFRRDGANSSHRLLMVRDDGVGAGTSLSTEMQSGVGTQIVEALALQLGGTLETVVDQGTEVRIRFNRNAFGEVA